MTDILKKSDGFFLTSIWTIDPFASALRQQESSQSFQFPVLKTQWNAKWQITLKFTRKSPAHQQSSSISPANRNSYELNTTLVKLSDDAYSPKGEHSFFIVVLIDKALNGKGGNFTLHSGTALNSTLYIDNTEVWLCRKKLEVSLKILFSPDSMVGFGSVFFNNARFAAIRRAEQLHDITILVDGQELKANKTVLALASPVFFAMFNPEFKERHEQRICIEDTDVRTMEKFLDFVYTHKNPDFVDVKSTIRLFRLAEKYKVSTLRQSCLRYLRASTADENGFVEMLLSFQRGTKRKHSTMSTM